MTRYIQFIFLFVVSISCYSQDLVQTVNFKEVEFKLPSNWSYELEELESNLLYQITCSRKDNGDTFVVQWIEAEIDLEEYLEIMKTTFKEGPTHKGVVFTENKAGVFHDNKTLYSVFTGELLGYKFSGRAITFNNDGKTFIIMHQGDNTFYKAQTAEKIMSSLKIGRLRDLIQLEVPKTWILYDIENIGQIALPPTLELRDDNSFVAQGMGKIQDYYVTHKKIKMLKPQIYFQPKGMDNLEKEALSKYARVLITYIKGEDGDFFKWNEKFELTDSELQELDSYFKDEVVSPMDVMNIKLIKWYPLEFGSVNGLSYMKMSFTRQMGSNPIVRVDNYKFYNSDEAIELTLSYRLSESDTWKDDFSKVIKTFDFKTRK